MNYPVCYKREYISDKHGVKQHESKCMQWLIYIFFFKWLSFFILTRLFSVDHRDGAARRFWKTPFLWELHKAAVSFEDRSRCIQSILSYYFPEKCINLQLSTTLSNALLSDSEWKVISGWNSVTILRGLMLKVVCNQCFGIVIQLLQLAKSKTQTSTGFFNHMKLKLNIKWHLCLFGCKHLDWLSLCMGVEQQVSLCIYGCSGPRAAGA